MNLYFLLRRKQLNVSQVIVLAFLAIILLGSLLLMLPISTRTGRGSDWLTALFTATSAVCVTGLSLVDIWSFYSFFGQTVILLLMETGGLGFMSVVSFIIYLSKHTANIQSLSLIAESLGASGIQNIARIQKRLIIGSLLVESAGAFILSAAFVSSVGYGTGIWFGIFHAISAFCNAGFDLMGYFSPGLGLEAFQDNPIVLVTIALLIIIGGIGFVVWDDILSARQIRRWSPYSKLVIAFSGLLIILATLLFFLFESGNPQTIGSMSVSGKILNSFFQAVTPRTAGFASVSQSSLTDTSKALTTLLMMIGGSSGSTAGGIKTITFLIVICSITASLFGRKKTLLLHREISQEQISQANMITGSFIILSITGAFFINISADAAFTQSLFESISALATVGLSLGITGSLDGLSKIVLIVLMFIGRVGLLNLTLGFFRSTDKSNIKYPTAHLIIG